MPEEQQVPRESSGGGSVEPSCRVYVGNLSWRVRWQDLKDHMKQAGEVVRADVFEDFQGKSKGCGIVQYENVEGAQKAIKELTDSELFDRLIFVREDREDEHRLPGGRRGGYGSSSNFYFRRPRYYFGSSWRGRRGGTFGFDGRTGYGWTSSNRVREVGSREGHAAGGVAGASGAAAAASSGRRNTNSGRLGGGSGITYRRYYGRGGFYGPPSGNFFAFGGGGRGGRRPGGRGGFRGGGMRGGSFGGYGGYRGGRGGYAGGGGPPPAGGECAGRQIFVSNLPWRTSWQDLKDLFRECGDVVRADVMMMPDGRSKGVGTVLFASPEGADRAVQMFNDYMLDGRPILVRIDRVA